MRGILDIGNGAERKARHVIATSEIFPTELRTTQVPVREVRATLFMVEPFARRLAIQWANSNPQVYREPGLSDAEYEKIKRNML